MDNFLIAALATLVLCIWNMYDACRLSGESESLRNEAVVKVSLYQFKEAADLRLQAYKANAESYVALRWALIMSVGFALSVAGIIWCLLK